MSRRVLAVVVWLFLGTPGYTQTLGTITGEVKDQSGGTIPGATVTAQNVATNAVRIQQSNEAGVYTFPAMPPGMYQVKAELQGFRTVQNAVLRRAAHQNDDEAPSRLDVEDFAVAETERRTTAAVALCVDLSFSMVQEGRWRPMKQTALALAHLISTRFRNDALEIIGFDRTARRLTPLDLAEVEPEWVQGTNLQHALKIAGRHLRRHPDAEPVVLVVTDGEPTAHLDVDGYPLFHWPPTDETVRATVGEVDAMTRLGATLNFFLLGDDPGLARFVDAVARRNGGRVLTPENDQLGQYVVADYLRSRRASHRARRTA